MTKAQQHEALIAEYRKTMDKEVLHCWAKDACTAMGLLHARVQELEAQLSARQDGMEPLAWRKRADEIELQVAKSGSTEAMRCFTDMRTLLQAATAPQATQPQAPAAPAVDALAERDAAFEAMRQRLCRVPRWSFHLDARGNIRRMDDASGNWIEFSAAHALFDPVAVDAAIAAQAKEGGA